ncbi:MAG: hypothetical protein QXI33_02095 [Candidatus Pacearchaeota archaeon]
MEVLEIKENALLNRDEIVATLESEKTPSKKEVAEKISGKLKKNINNIIIDKIECNFGTHKFLVKAKIYTDEKSKDKYEVVTRKQRKKIIEEKKKNEEL